MANANPFGGINLLSLVDAVNFSGFVSHESGLLVPEKELSLGQVVAFALPNAKSATIGSKTIYDPKGIWVAHTPSLNLSSATPLRYGIRNEDGYQLVLPSAVPGQEITIFGDVPTPELEIFTGTRHDHTLRERIFDPYYVAVISGAGDRIVSTYRNVPHLKISF